MNQALKEFKSKCTQSELALIEKAFELSNNNNDTVVSNTINEFDKEFSQRIRSLGISYNNIEIIKSYWLQSVDAVKEKLLNK